MWEDIEKHEKLVSQLVEKIKDEYDKEVEIFMTSADILSLRSQYSKEQIIEEISIRSTLLSYIKTNIIDTNGAIFNDWIRRDGKEGKAIYYLKETDIYILLSENFYVRLLCFITRGHTNINAIRALLALSGSNIRNLISILERVIFDKDMEGFDFNSDFRNMSEE